MSSTSAPISIASPTSAMSSPAFGPTMPGAEHAAASRGRRAASSGRRRRRSPARGRTPTTGTPPSRRRRRCALASRLGQPDPGDLGLGVGDGRDRRATSKRDVVAGDHLGGDVALVRRLVGEHRLPDDVADREDVRDVRALLRRRPATKPRSSTSTPGGVEARGPRRWARGRRRRARGRTTASARRRRRTSRAGRRPCASIVARPSS